MSEPHTIYNPGQFKVVFPHLKGVVPEWLVLGGPADANEAQTAVEEWSELKVIGVEPSAKMCEFQTAQGWPGILVQKALSDAVGYRTIRIPKGLERCSTLLLDLPGELVGVETTTVDTLDGLYGPFRNCVLWLDIEGWEGKALEGARGLFEREDVLLVNLEWVYQLGENRRQIGKFMREYGFQLAETWDVRYDLCEDRIYVSERLK